MALTAEDHNHVLQWAHILDHQVLRLRQSRAEAVAMQGQVRARGHHTVEDNQPFHRMVGDAHFVLIACVQLFRALKNYDGRLRLPTRLDESELRNLRNALEHWDDDDGPAARVMARLGVDPASHTWSQAEGRGRLGELVDDEDLRQWAKQVHDDLANVDPPSPLGLRTVVTDADPQSRFLVDRATAEPWVAVAHSARLMADLLTQVGEPVAGSNFDQINAHYPWERSSDWCRGYLTAALQHMELWADHVAPLHIAEGAEVTHQFRPVQTLSRAAVEAAAQAVWVMDGSSARECALRHLCLVLHDFDEQGKAAPEETKSQVKRAKETLLERVSPMVTEQEIGRSPATWRL